MKQSNSSYATLLTTWYKRLSIYLGVLAFLFCSEYVLASMSAPLLAATAAEGLLIIIGLVVLRLSGKLKLEWLRSRVPKKVAEIGRSANAIALAIKACILGLLSVVATWEFIALANAVHGSRQLSEQMYISVPYTFWVGLHPAIPLEFYGGALVEKKAFEEAQPIYESILRIRSRVAGPKSDLVGALYADLGDLSIRKNDLPSARDWYGKSVAIGSKTGRALTGLATTLREMGQLTESEACYKKALAIRATAFGTDSKQYRDTMRGYNRLAMMLREQRKQTTSN